jgi:hypothetical protein
MIGLTLLQLLAGVTVSAMVVVVGLALELVPVMVTVEVPDAAELEAVKVTTLEVVAGLGAMAAVTPLGRPEAAKFTRPVKPPTSVTVMVSKAMLP